MADPTVKEARDEQLDALKEAFDEYYEKEKTRIQAQVTLMNAIKDGRGLGELQDNVLTSLGELAQDDLDSYLSG